MTNRKTKKAPADGRARRPAHRQADMMRERGYVTIRDAMELTGVSETNVYGWVRDGRVRTMRCGSRVYIERASLEQYQPVARLVREGAEKRAAAG